MPNTGNSLSATGQLTRRTTNSSLTSNISRAKSENQSPKGVSRTSSNFGTYNNSLSRRQSGRSLARPFRISSHKRRRSRPPHERSTPQYGMPRDTSKTEGQTTLTTANKQGSMIINAANQEATKTATDKGSIFSRVISALQGIFGDSHTQNEAAKNFASLFVDDTKENKTAIDFTGKIGPREKQSSTTQYSYSKAA